MLLSEGHGEAEGCVSLVLSECGWVIELAVGLLTHWDNNRAEEDKNRSAQHMGPFRLLYLLSHRSQITLKH